MKKRTVVILIILLILLVAVPMIVLGGKAEFSGSDGQAEELIMEADPDYEPWFSPVMERIFPDGIPSELESLFFCLQAAIGSGIVCFAIGYMVARSKYKKEA
ncbi:MAG: energy-coupling factor ABC transporter substrate-binding protein [Clostridiales bacterium]|nr:energy-coupling factor ABC transporter substrate-binding protein [Clostridiales bacterium]MDY3747728.1 energy-coupling factor ABC transporter substrate-binding protein [Lachnospiraceae bacterium]